MILVRLVVISEIFKIIEFSVIGPGSQFLTHKLSVKVRKSVLILRFIYLAFYCSHRIVMLEMLVLKIFHIQCVSATDSLCL